MASEPIRDPTTDDLLTPQNATREEEIRNRAYEIYLQRGGQPGYELKDWLQAEREFTK